MTLSWFEGAVALAWGLFVGLGFVAWVRRDSARVLLATDEAGPRARRPGGLLVDSGTVDSGTTARKLGSRFRAVVRVRIVVTALAVFAPALWLPVSVSASLMGFLVGRNFALRARGAMPRPPGPRRARAEVTHAH